MMSTLGDGARPLRPVAGGGQPADFVDLLAIKGRMMK
jgi:hypothetical protein